MDSTREEKREKQGKAGEKIPFPLCLQLKFVMEMEKY